MEKSTVKKCKVLDEANGISDTIDNFNLEDKNQYHKIKNDIKVTIKKYFYFSFTWFSYTCWKFKKKIY